MMQVNNLEQFLAWVKSSPCQFTVSSMSGGYVHVKFLVPCDKEITSAHWYNTLVRLPIFNERYEDGFRDGAKERLDKGITDTTVFRRPNHEDFIPVDDDGVWKVSATTMNLLYAMFLWSGKNGIDNEDDWEDHLKLMREHLNNLQGAKK